jgi:hypothetical protein
VGAIAIANAVKDMEALSKLIFGGDKNNSRSDLNAWDSERKPATLEVGTTEANFGSKNLGAGGAIIISAWLTHRDQGALTKLDISNNSIEQGEALEQIIEYCNTKGIKLDNHKSESGGD